MQEAAERLVCLSPIPWAAAWTSRHSLCEAWAKSGHRVLFVDPPVPLGRAQPHGGPEIANITVLRPPRRVPHGPLARTPRLAAAVARREARRYARAVAGAADGWGGSGPLVLFNSFMPVLGRFVAEELRPEVVVYHRADELAAFARTTEADLAAERLVLRDADLVICVSEAVRESVADHRPDALVLTNGVDTDFFAAEPAEDSRLADLPRPRVGLVGRIDKRNDPAFLQAAASAAAAFVVIGPVFDVSLPAGSTELGWCAREELPALLAGLDVGVLCYRSSYPGNPLKVYEYLAAGLPVVSSAFSGLGDVAADIRVASDPDEFAAAVHEEVELRTPAADRDRRRAATKYSWNQRANEIMAAIRASVLS